MSKVTLYSIDREAIKKVNIGTFNPTCRAIIKQLFILSKDEDFIGISPTDLLVKCVETGLWKTSQEPSKYHTTFAFYKKLLVEKAHVFSTLTLDEASEEEFLEDEEEEETEV